MIDLTGQVFGRWTVLKLSKKKGCRREKMWYCRCLCGKERSVKGTNLRKGITQSCGCLIKDKHTIHGDNIRGACHKLYYTWQSMKSRCNNPKNPRYSRYGARGIIVCDEWKEYIMFKNWAINNGYADNLSIDRINNDGNYEPINCRWVTMKQQGRNKGNNHIVEINGIKKSVVEWAEIYKINSSIANSRLWLGWTPEEAFTIPPAIRGGSKCLRQNNA